MDPKLNGRTICENTFENKIKQICFGLTPSENGVMIMTKSSMFGGLNEQMEQENPVPYFKKLHMKVSRAII